MVLKRNEIAVKKFEDAAILAEVLLKNDYVVMLSKEENLLIINYVWSEHEADRNDMIFGRYDEIMSEIENQDDTCYWDNICY